MVPPALVGLVMSAVMVVLEKEPSWPNVKQEIKDKNFINKLHEATEKGICQSIANKLRFFVNKKEFQPVDVAKASVAACLFCEWVLECYKIGQSEGMIPAEEHCKPKRNIRVSKSKESSQE